MKREETGVLASGWRTVLCWEGPLVLQSPSLPMIVSLSRTSVHIFQSNLPVAATFAMSLSSSRSEVSLPDSYSSWEHLRKLGGGKGRDPRCG